MRIYPNTEYLRNDMGVTVQQSGDLLESGPRRWLQKNLGFLVAAPFAPFALMVRPLTEIIKDFAKMLSL